MIIKNPRLIREMRKAGRCYFCGKQCKKREGAHIISRGAGGSDLRCNVVPLGSTKNFECRCHTNNHNGVNPDRVDLLAIVSRRLACTSDDILIVIRFVQQLDKYASSYSITEALLKLPEPARAIARNELEEAGKL